MTTGLFSVKHKCWCSFFGNKR